MLEIVWISDVVHASGRAGERIGAHTHYILFIDYVIRHHGTGSRCITTSFSVDRNISSHQFSLYILYVIYCPFTSHGCVFIFCKVRESVMELRRFVHA